MYYVSNWATRQLGHSTDSTGSNGRQEHGEQGPRYRHRAGIKVARKTERKGFFIIYVYMFAWLELSLVGFSPSPVRASIIGLGFLSFIVVYICMDPSGDRIR